MYYILADCSKGGICRNLKNIINAMRHADYYNYNLLIFWPKYIRVMDKEVNNFIQTKNIDLNSIINFKNKNYIIIDDSKLLKNYNIKKTIIDFKINILPNEYQYNFFSELNNYFISDGKQIVYEFDNIPIEINNDIIKHIKNIEINKNIMDKINLLFKNKTKIIGVTIRTWPEHLERRKYFNINNYYKIIDSIINEYNYIFVCSDETKQIKNIKKKYGDKVIINGNLDDEKSGSWSINLNDIIDLFSLSKCDILIGNLTSNYTEFIWYLTGCKIKYITVNEIPNDRIDNLIKNGKLKKYNFLKNA